MITVLAGVNGAGKSSIGGSTLREAGQDWYNPDEVARAMCELYVDRPLQAINGQVWREGVRRLEAAIRADSHFAFETTLGGKTITDTLLDAIAAGVAVSIWCCGLTTAELHITRVAARVARGGHAIPEAMIRARYKTSMRNLCRLAPGLHQLAVYDNSQPLGDYGDGLVRPNIRRLLHVTDGSILEMTRAMPDWAKPVAGVCLSRFV